jgi:hypothetical protein
MAYEFFATIKNILPSDVCSEILLRYTSLPSRQRTIVELLEKRLKSKNLRRDKLSIKHDDAYDSNIIIRTAKKNMYNHFVAFLTDMNLKYKGTQLEKTPKHYIETKTSRMNDYNNWRDYQRSSESDDSYMDCMGYKIVEMKVVNYTITILMN